jgi:adenylate kinase family enzyme
LDQLEEAKGNEGAEADPKAKGGKGKASKSPAEIQDEIAALYKTEVEGWILIDFPRNLNQAKKMENLFLGYQSITDVPKSQDK